MDLRSIPENKYKKIIFVGVFILFYISCELQYERPKWKKSIQN